jgi:hypothetical protein
VKELLFDAQGLASIPGVEGVIKAQHSQTMVKKNCLLYEIKKPKNFRRTKTIEST